MVSPIAQYHTLFQITLQNPLSSRTKARILLIPPNSTHDGEYQDMTQNNTPTYINPLPPNSLYRPRLDRKSRDCTQTSTEPLLDRIEGIAHKSTRLCIRSSLSSKDTGDDHRSTDVGYESTYWEPVEKGWSSVEPGERESDDRPRWTEEDWECSSMSPGTRG